MYEQILREIDDNPFYKDNFSNDGQRFVAWYLHRVLLLDMHETRGAITDGQSDKQIDAIVVEDGEQRRVRVIQGKFVPPKPIDGAPLREVLSAWERFKNLPQLQTDCSGKLAERLEAARVALEDDYDLQFELLTTGFLTPDAEKDFTAFRDSMETDATYPAELTLVNAELIQTRLFEAEQRELPELQAEIKLDADRCLVTEEAGFRVIIALLPVAQCLELPGISDGKLFRRNVRQNLGITTKVNKGIRKTLMDKSRLPYIFFFHNGITALCKSFLLSEDKTKLEVSDLAVVNGCQSLSTIYSTGGKVANSKNGSVLFRIYEIPQRDMGDAISINTNSQSAVKPRDLRSNDKFMLATKRRYEHAIQDGYFITKRGEKRPADKKEEKTIDATDYARVIISWICQRPNLASNEKRLFDEYYKTIFHPELDPQSMLALRLWLVEIDNQWELLDLNQAIKAVRGAARFHMLFAISQLIAHASNQSDKIPSPAATIPALKYSGLVLAQAKGCLNQALAHAITQSEAASKVFSPQNWLKGKGAVSDEQLVAGTIVNVLKNMQSPELAPALSSITLSADKFSSRWSAD